MKTVRVVATGNVPSAKIGFANEAAFYLSFLPNSFEKYIVMLHATHGILNKMFRTVRR